VAIDIGFGSKTNGMIKRIFMVTMDFSPIDGVAEQIVLLATILAKQNVRVWVFTRRPVDPSNQYTHRLRQVNIQLVHPPRWLSGFGETTWDQRARIMRSFIICLSPILFLVTLFDALFRRRALPRSWQAVRGGASKLLSPLFLPDYLDRIFYYILKRHIKRYTPDLVHVHRTNFVRATQWCHKQGIVTVYTEHSTPVPQRKWDYHSISALNSADRVIAVSNAVKDGLINVANCIRPVDIIYNVVFDPNFVTKDLPKQENRKLTIMYVGRLAPEKGIDQLLKAVKQLSCSNLQVIIVGEGVEHARLQQLTEELNITSQVIFNGYVDNELIPRLIQSSDIFVLPSVIGTEAGTEGLPQVVLTAMACGVAMVITAVGGSVEVLAHDSSAMFVPPDNYKELAIALQELIENPQKRAVLGQQARLVYEQGVFSPDKAIMQVLQTYERAIESHKKCLLNSN
jgi:glycosyltransferase involved in cell wall biosynthesis